MLEKTNKLLQETMSSLKQTRSKYIKRRSTGNVISDQDSFKPGSESNAHEANLKQLEKKLEELQDNLIDTQEHRDEIEEEMVQSQQKYTQLIEQMQERQINDMRYIHSLESTKQDQKNQIKELKKQLNNVI
jgi:chromosome segregation ATPase